jgi:hypothetical protein
MLSRNNYFESSSARTIGGTLAIFGQAEIGVIDCMIVNSTCTDGNGGSFWFEMTAGLNDLFNVNSNYLIGSSAPRGGGAVVYMVAAAVGAVPELDVSSPDVGNIVIEWDLPYPPALYGRLQASNVVIIVPSMPAVNIYPGQSFAGLKNMDLMNISIQATDAYNQSIIAGGLVVQVVCNLITSSPPNVRVPQLTGTILQQMTIANGAAAIFDDLVIQADPGEYELVFSLIGLDIVSPIHVPLLVRSTCPLGLYYDSVERRCRDCGAAVLVYDPIQRLCAPCRPGWQAMQLGVEIICILCPAGQTGTGGECKPCGSNTYQPSPGQPCQSCLAAGMSGLKCEAEFAQVQEGWFAYSTRDDATGALTLQTAQCPEGFCAGSYIQTNWTDPINLVNGSLVSTAPIFPSAVTRYDQCAYPRLAAADNLLCGRCVSGHIPWGDKCTACDSTNGGLIVLLIVLSIALVLFLLRSASMQSSAGHSVIVLYFIQTAMLEVGSANNLLAWLNIALFSPNSTSQCIAPLGVYEQATLQLVTPIILFGELMLIGGLHYLASKKFARAATSFDGPYLQPSDLRERVLSVLSAFSPDLYISATLTLLLFSYTQVTEACLSYVACVDVGGVSVVFTQPSMRCASTEYRRYLILVICAMITYVAGFPLAVFAFLWKNYSLVLSSHTHMEAEVKAANLTVNKSNSSSAIVTSGGPSAHPAVSQFLRRYSPLFSMYSSRAWFWQVLVLARRCTFVAISVSLVRTPAEKFLAYSLAHLVSLLLQLHFRPFSVDFFNHAEFVSHLLLILLSESLIAVLPPYSTSTQVYLFAIVVPPVIIYLIAALRMVLDTRKREHIRAQQTIEDAATAAADDAYDHPPLSPSSAHEVGIEMNSIPPSSTVTSSHHVDSSRAAADRSVAPDSDLARVLPAHAVDSSDGSMSDHVHESASMPL